MMAFITRKSFWRAGRISFGLARRRSAGLTTHMNGRSRANSSWNRA